MRQQHQVVGPQKVRRNLRLTVIDVQPRAANGAEPQGLRKGVFIHHLTPRGVDQEGIGAHQVQPGAIDQMPVGRPTGAMQRHEIAVRQQGLWMAR